MKVCHITSAHRSDDTRIFIHECSALAAKGYEVYLVAQGESREENGVHVIGVGAVPASRKERMTGFAQSVVRKALSLDCDLYHLHDPELMRFIPRIARTGKKVVFDSHEDYKSTMLAKAWIPKPLRGAASAAYTVFERHVCRHLDGYIACYHWTRDRVEKWVPNIRMVFNFPEWSPVQEKQLPPDGTSFFCYAGGISAQWLHQNAIKAIAAVPGARYMLAGSLGGSYCDGLKAMPEWSAVEFIGRLKQNELQEKMYSRSVAGMCLLDYIPQCKGTVGNLSNTKFFEYMLNGLPLICTNFDLWKEIVDTYRCGICVDPHNVEEIAAAIQWMIDNPEEARQMGRRGNAAVKEKYNWTVTAQGLFQVYEAIEKTMG